MLKLRSNKHLQNIYNSSYQANGVYELRPEATRSLVGFMKSPT